MYLLFTSFLIYDECGGSIIDCGSGLNMLRLTSCYIREMDHTWTMQGLSNPYHLLLFVASGQLVYWVDGMYMPLQKDDVLFAPAGSIRSGKSLERHQRYVVFFTVHEDESTALPLLVKKQACKIRLQNPTFFKQRFSLLNHHWMMKGSNRDIVCNAILLEMLTAVNEDADQDKTASRKRELVKAMQDYILQHYNEPIKLQQLADLCGMSPNYISAVFRAETGYTPISYVNEVRVSVAKDMMLAGDMSIGEIAEIVGFCDQAYFNRVFRKIHGCSPSQFMSQKNNSSFP